MREKLHYLNNIKVTLTIFVILVHVAVTYGSVGGWYYYEHGNEEWVNILLTAFNAIQQSYFMGFFFFISALFIPRSYEKHGAIGFIKKKAIRLGLPLLLYMFVISPTIRVMLIKMNEFDNRSVWTVFIQDGYKYIGTGPLWFVMALLIFCSLYIVMKRIIKQKEAYQMMLPSNKRIAISLILVGLITFVVRLTYPVGTAVYNFQFCYFTFYIYLFIAGLMAYRGNWLEQMTSDRVIVWWRISVVMLIALPIVMVLGGDNNAFMGGLNWQALFYAMWEPFAAMGIMMKFIDSYRRKLNYVGPIQQYLSKNAYTVYILHAPLLVWISLLLKDLELHSLIKAIVIAMLVIPITYFAADLFRRLPILRKAL